MSREFTRRTCTCLACGGEWFRDVSYHAFLPEESWPIWPDLTGHASHMPMTVCVCLCGTPLNPEIGGLRGGKTPNYPRNGSCQPVPGLNCGCPSILPLRKR
jgi:hypothetical protein